MAQILAIDWDQREARFVLAVVSGQALRIQAAATVPLGESPDRSDDKTPDDQTSDDGDSVSDRDVAVGEALRRAL